MAKTEVVKVYVKYVIETDGIYCGEGCKHRDVNTSMAFQKDGCRAFGVDWLKVGGGGLKRLRCKECLIRAPIKSEDT